MLEENQLSPAEQASLECLEKVFNAIDNNNNFRVEAGAGAGKTYTLIKALKHLIAKNEIDYHKTGKKIACITYTNVARDEIRSRTDNHPIVLADTIHAFAWQVIQSFQKSLRERIGNLGEKWMNRIEEAGGIKKQQVIYSLGYPKITESEIFLHHNDVIKLFTSLLSDMKFKRIFLTRYPVLLIDEYQDTNKDLATAIVTNFIETTKGPLVGLFGDHWQKIYGTESCGLIEAEEQNLIVIGKRANFRSDKLIVGALNKMRPELTQFEYDPSSLGEILVFHSNRWQGQRRIGGHWAGDLPPDVAHNALEKVKSRLSEQGWSLEPGKTKILMLTNNVLAAEQGYQTIASLFSDNDDYLKKKDDYIAFLTDTIEVGSEAFEQRKYGIMADTFRINTGVIRKHSDKRSWHESMMRLNELRSNYTIGDVIDHLKETNKPRLTRRIEEKEKRIKDISAVSEEDRSEEDKRLFSKVMSIRSIPYTEISNVARYIEDKTLYSTKHGVKGAEFENVIVVLGRGWNQYNWSQFLELARAGPISATNKDSFERNRNLFYVACSRAKKRLCLLFTQELSSEAILTLQDWFGDVIDDNLF